MNSSAKLTVVSLLATAALGVAIGTQGCTVTSGTSNDTDGGTSSSSSTSSSSGGSNDSGVGSNTCGGGGGTACQTCLDTNCCDKLTAARAIQAVDDSGATIGGEKYIACIDDCQGSADATACEQECDSFAAPGVIDAYNEIVKCSEAHCQAECLGGNADAGADAGDGG